ncbi:8-oxoguanine deaminase [Pseudonocardia nantongensis]|uniref:8-oxoguanine deaminase n=1 Tax=Pseudonocardia nantongensis TaxID=1181885 RepID=UPI00397AC66F
MEPIVIEGAHVVTVSGPEYPDGHVVVEGNRIAGVGAGPAPRPDGARVIDGRGCLLTPGLVNTHHHLYQWVTRGLAVDATLFEWLSTLYPVWAGIDEHAVHTGATGALARLALSGCTTSTDHHYVFPREGGDLLGAEIAAASEVGLRFHPTRGSMDLGRSSGGLPPDHVVEDPDTILAASADAVARWHDPAPDAMTRIALAPCSPFSVTGGLMRDSAALARELGVRMHTHLAETADETDFCREHFGCTPTEYVAGLGWTGDDVWFAHTVHLDDDAVKTIGSTGTGVAHCPTSNGRLGAGIARVRDLLDAGARVGLGVDGAASNEGTHLLEEVKHAVLFARAVGGPTALGVRQALELGTLGGARVLGRGDQIGSIDTGKLADLALWRLDGLAHADVADPVAALVLGSPPPLRLLLVNGRAVVEDDRVGTVDTDAVAAECAAVHRTLLDRAG